MNTASGIIQPQVPLNPPTSEAAIKPTFTDEERKELFQHGVPARTIDELTVQRMHAQTHASHHSQLWNSVHRMIWDAFERAGSSSADARLQAYDWMQRLDEPNVVILCLRPKGDTPDKTGLLLKVAPLAVAFVHTDGRSWLKQKVKEAQKPASSMTDWAESLRTAQELGDCCSRWKRSLSSRN
jgi:hypothetical protein